MRRGHEDLGLECQTGSRATCIMWTSMNKGGSESCKQHTSLRLTGNGSRGSRYFHKLDDDALWLQV